MTVYEALDATRRYRKAHGLPVAPTLRMCRKCKRIHLPVGTVDEDLPGHWVHPPDCFVPSLAVTLCCCPNCSEEQEKVE